MSRSLGLVENLAKDSRRYSPVINNDDLKSGCCEAFLCRPNCDILLCCSSVLSRNFYPQYQEWSFQHSRLLQT